MALVARNIVGWTANTDARVEHLYSPQTRWPMLHETFCKLPATFAISLEILREVQKKAQQTFGLRPIVVNPLTKKKRRTYRGIGLTTRPGSTDSRYEAVRFFQEDGTYISSAKSLGRAAIQPQPAQGVEFERMFTEANDVAPDLVQKICSMFPNWDVTKVRLLELQPEGVVPPHYDHPYYEQIRLHAVIETNPDVYWEVAGRQFQIPADGNLYWFDAGRVHSVYNFGSTPRTVLSIHLCPKQVHRSEHMDVNELLRTGRLW